MPQEKYQPALHTNRKKERKKEGRGPAVGNDNQMKRVKKGKEKNH